MVGRGTVNVKKTKSEVGAMQRKPNASFVVVVIVCTSLLCATRIVGQDPNPLGTDFIGQPLAVIH